MSQSRNAMLNDEREVLLPRTLPVRSINDLAPYHWVRNEKGNLSLRKGAPPKVVKAAIADLANGQGSLDDMLTRIGVPQG